MFELIAAFTQYIVWGAVLWVLFFVAFAGLFASGRLGAFAAGIARVLWAIFASPFVFVKRAVASVMAFTPEEERAYRESDQYLLNKAMLVLQAILIVVAIGALAAMVVLTWNTLVPPGEVRRDAKAYVQEVETQRQKSIAANSRLATLDREWNAKSAQVIAKHRNAQEKTIANAGTQMRAYEKDIATYGNQYVTYTLGRIRELAASGSLDSIENIDYTRRRMSGAINEYWYWLGDWGRQVLNQWSAQWEEGAQAQFLLNTIGADELRRREQPQHDEARLTRDREAETLATMERILSAKQEEASLKWKAAGWRALKSFAAFLLYLWFGGMLIEAGWLAIRVADDVRRMRRQPAPVESLPVSVEPRLPIRAAAGIAAPSQPAEA